MALRIKRCVVRGARPQGITAPSGTFRVPGPRYGARAHITGHQTVLWGTRPGSVLGLGLLEKESLHRELGQGLSPAEPHHDQQHTPGKRASLGRACYLTPPNRALKILFFFLPWTKVPAAPRLLLALRLPRSAPLVLPRVLPPSRKPWRAALILPCLRGRAKQMPLCLLHPPPQVQARYPIPRQPPGPFWPGGGKEQTPNPTSTRELISLF